MAKEPSKLLPSSDVVVEFGDKKQVNTQTGNVETVDKARRLVLTYSGFQAIETNEEGYSAQLGRTVKLLGTPKYKEEQSPINPKGTIKVLDGFDKFATEKAKDETPPAA